MASFTNMATLSYNGSQINSNVVTGELRDALTITKTAVSGGYRPGDTVTYVVTLSNTGTAALTGLTLTDDLGGSTAAAGTVYPLAYVPGSVLYYNGGTVQPAPTAARLEPELTISKALSPAVVTGNGPLTYTFTIRNTGNTALTGQEGAVITDTFDPILNITGVTFNGTAWTSPEDYTYDAATGAFATVAGKLTVPEAAFTQNANGSWTVTPGQSVLTVTGTV